MLQSVKNFKIPKIFDILVVLKKKKHLFFGYIEDSILCTIGTWHKISFHRIVSPSHVTEMLKIRRIQILFGILEVLLWKNTLIFWFYNRDLFLIPSLNSQE